VIEILELAGACGVLVGTGHIDEAEALAVSAKAGEVGAQVIATHVGWQCIGRSRRRRRPGRDILSALAEGSEVVTLCSCLLS
jgi:hypothetical protein